MHLLGFAPFPRVPPSLRWSSWIAFGLLQSYLVVVAVLYLFQRSLIYPTYGVPDETTRPFGVNRVEIATSDGERLLGYWVRPLPGRPLLLSFHGNASSPSFHARRFSSAPWSSQGWGFLAIAYRGYPGSTGSPSESGLAKDAEAALRFVRDRIGDAPVVVHGHSLGAAVGIGLAARHPVSALFLEAPFLSLPEAAAARFPWLPTFLLRDRFPSHERAPGLALPVHIVHGEEDPVVPYPQGQALAALFPHAAFHGLSSADHASVFGAADRTVEEALRGALASALPEAIARPR